MFKSVVTSSALALVFGTLLESAWSEAIAREFLRRPHSMRMQGPVPQGVEREFGLTYASAPDSENRVSPPVAPVDLEKLEELNALSAALVEKAGAGSTPAHEFRIEARMYRELLRKTMLRDRERQQQERLPQPLLLDMVRMSALLHSAADCKTGFVITCPVDLMLQLQSQQAKIAQGLVAGRAASK